MNPITIGRTVLYVLSEQDAQNINNRRALSQRIYVLDLDYLPKHASANYGNQARAGDICPAIAVRVFCPPGQEQNLQTPVNFQVLLDGDDSYWATSRHQDPAKTPGTWHWPDRA